MKKKNLRPLILSSLAALATAGIGTGATFALFTDKAETAIQVEAGIVKLRGTTTLTSTYSAIPNPNGNVLDENGGKYTLTDQANQTFVNGGSAVLNNSVLSLNHLTPGDGIRFKMATQNGSNVSTKYRFVIQGNDTGIGLLRGLKLSISNSTLGIDEQCDGLYRYITQWSPLQSGEQIGTFDFDLYLPLTAGNDYQGLSAELAIRLEAVQGNTVVDDDDAGKLEIKGLRTSGDLPNLNTPAYWVVEQDIPVSSLNVFTQTNGNSVLDLNGHEIFADTGILAPWRIGTLSGENAKLTIRDTSASGDGTIKTTAPYCFMVANGAKLVLEEGTLETSANTPVFLQNASYEMRGGHLKGEVLGVIATGTHDQVSIHGGEIESKQYILQSSAGASSHFEFTMTDGYLHTEHSEGMFLLGQTDFHMTGGKIEAKDRAITTNGGDSLYSDFKFEGGEVKSLESAAFDLAGCNSFTMTGGKITGECGLIQRAGRLNITGGSITATGDPLRLFQGKSSGWDGGDGIAVIFDQHNTRQDMVLNITGGTFSGKIGIAYENTLGNSSIRKDKSTIDKDTSGTDEDANAEFSCTVKGASFVGDTIPVVVTDNRAAIDLDDSIVSALPSSISAKRGNGEDPVTLTKDTTTPLYVQG